MSEAVPNADTAPVTSRIEWVRSNCRLLNAIAAEFARTRPFAGLTIGTAIHLEPKTAPLLEEIAASYGTRKFEQTETHRGRLTVAGDPIPWQFHEGVLLAALREINVQADVRTTPRAVNEVDYVIEWA